MKIIKTIHAENHVLCHDITQIVPGQFKGARFKKRHIVRKEDIPVLLSLGKEYLYIWENDDTKCHENEAALILYQICAGSSEYITPTNIQEGKIEGIAAIDGLLKLDTELLYQINALDELMIAARQQNIPVRKGEKLFGTRVIPLLIDKSKLEKAVEIAAGRAVVQLFPFKPKKVGLVTTGSEIYKGLIPDSSMQTLRPKLQDYGSDIYRQIIVDDAAENTEAAIRELLNEGADMILCSGGMSVDPDDRTPLAIRNSGSRIVSYGSPVLPGAMFLLSYMQRGDVCIPILGLPGCCMYAKKTIFDVLLPRIMADDIIEASQLHKLGKGGLCLNCNICHFPNCAFGKGWD